ncbi:MAG: hypothetical protein NZ519_13795, partial [Bacteroidia bacterium]|nr:hypothetical protein [Bacteroidia bacterium]
EGHGACRQAVRSVSVAPQRTRSAECTDPSAARGTPRKIQIIKTTIKFSITLLYIKIRKSIERYL